MFEQYSLTNRSRTVLTLAKQEASRLEHPTVNIYHLLLGLAKEGSGVAATALNNCGVNLLRLRVAVEKAYPRGTVALTSAPAFDPVIDAILGLAVQYASDQGDRYVGTECILITIFTRDPDSNPILPMLRDMGTDHNRVKDEVLALLGKKPRLVTVTAIGGDQYALTVSTQVFEDGESRNIVLLKALQELMELGEVHSIVVRMQEKIGPQ